MDTFHLLRQYSRIHDQIGDNREIAQWFQTEEAVSCHVESDGDARKAFAALDAHPTAAARSMMTGVPEKQG